MWGPREFKALLEANKNLGNFVEDLIELMDRGEVIDMIHVSHRELSFIATRCSTCACS